MPAWAAQLTGVSAQADLGDPLQIQVTLAGVGSSHVESVRSSLAEVQALVGLVRGPDLVGERDILARASVETTATGLVALRSQWERKDLERAARAFADWLENVLR